MIIKGNEFLEIGMKDFKNRELQLVLGNEKCEIEHVKYDENINENFQYKMIRIIEHDGTLLFTRQKMLEMFYELVCCKTVYDKLIKEVDSSKVKLVNYTIGDLKIESSRVSNSTKGFPMIEETFELPIYCELVLR